MSKVYGLITEISKFQQWQNALIIVGCFFFYINNLTASRKIQLNMYMCLLMSATVIFLLNNRVTCMQTLWILGILPHDVSIFFCCRGFYNTIVKEFCLFCCFISQVNSNGHGGTVSSPNITFSWASLNKSLTSTLCTYFCL